VNRVRVFVPRDAAALAVGADEVAAVLAAGFAERGERVEIVRNGSRGLFWLEPLVKEITASGLRGRGGAAFPAGIKWRTVLQTPAAQKYIACNADEGDSGTFSDRMTMEGDPCMLIEGMVIAGLAVGATPGAALTPINEVMPK
jgi:hypothetical protein